IKRMGDAMEENGFGPGVKQCDFPKRLRRRVVLLISHEEILNFVKKVAHLLILQEEITLEELVELRPLLVALTDRFPLGLDERADRIDFAVEIVNRGHDESLQEHRRLRTPELKPAVMAEDNMLEKVLQLLRKPEDARR